MFCLSYNELCRGHNQKITESSVQWETGFWEENHRTVLERELRGGGDSWPEWG